MNHSVNFRLDSTARQFQARDPSPWNKEQASTLKKTEACFASLMKLVHLVAAVAMLLVGTLHVLMQLLGAETLARANLKLKACLPFDGVLLLMTAEGDFQPPDTVAGKASATLSDTLLRAQWRGRMTLAVKLQYLCGEITEHATGFGIMPQNIAEKIREKTPGENGQFASDGHHPDTPQAAREQAYSSRRFYTPDDDDEGEGEEPPLLSSSGRGSRSQGLHERGSGLDPSSLRPAPAGSLPPNVDTSSSMHDKPNTSSMAASSERLREDPFLTGRKLEAFPEAGPPMSAVEPQRYDDPPASSKGDPRPPEGSLPNKWEWPPWCLNFKSPNIEVWVFDDDCSVGRWVAAQPQSRVVDKTGRDAYLCAEYLWDGEYYVQDFGPQHVRKKGESRTVWQALTQSEPYGSAELDATKVFKKKDEDDSLMDTKVFNGKKGNPGRDMGGQSRGPRIIFGIWTQHGVHSLRVGTFSC
ncbi:mas [Symbiodinium sp. CCMP2592]|nr:mas [Symbiodinium sp. CCMP2592]